MSDTELLAALADGFKIHQTSPGLFQLIKHGPQITQDQWEKLGANGWVRCCNGTVSFLTDEGKIEYLKRTNTP